jgi:hypothetical protein
MEQTTGQIMACLLAEMKANQEKMATRLEAKIEFQSKTSKKSPRGCFLYMC